MNKTGRLLSEDFSTTKFVKNLLINSEELFFVFCVGTLHVFVVPLIYNNL